MFPGNATLGLVLYVLKPLVVNATVPPSDTPTVGATVKSTKKTKTRMKEEKKSLVLVVLIIIIIYH